MKRPLTLDGLPRSQRAGFYLLETALLLLLGGAATVYCHGRYHPVFAGNPLYALPFWQRVVLMTALFSTLDGVWVLAPRRWEYPLPFESRYCLCWQTR